MSKIAIDYTSNPKLLLAGKLKARQLSEVTLMEIEALGFRAIQNDAQDVIDAVGIVVSALQGNYGMKLPEVKLKDKTV